MEPKTDPKKRAKIGGKGEQFGAVLCSSVDYCGGSAAEAGPPNRPNEGPFRDKLPGRASPRTPKDLTNGRYASERRGRIYVACGEFRPRWGEAGKQ